MMTLLKFKDFYALFILTLFILISGCTTQNKSVGLGGLIGAGAGTALGSIADPGKNGENRTRNVIVGGAVGGIAGMVTGSLIHQKTEKEKQKSFLQGHNAGSKRYQEKSPNLSTPKVESRWIEGKAVGNRYIDGHWEYIITEPVRWEEGQ